MIGISIKNECLFSIIPGVLSQLILSFEIFDTILSKVAPKVIITKATEITLSLFLYLYK